MTKVLAFLLTLLFSAQAYAAEMKVVDIETISAGTNKYLFITGDIVEADVAAYETLRKNNPDLKGVWLDSDGGEVQAGVQLALMIYEDNLYTAVDTKCMSICSLIFFAGDEKFITENAVLGVHSAYSVDRNGIKVRSDYANAGVLYAFGYMRVAPEIAGMWLTTSPDTFEPINSELNEKLGLGITTMKLQPQ